MELSNRQQTIKDTWENDICNILVNAVAGSGKTTMLMEILKICQHRTLFLAFNKSIQQEIAGKIETQELRQGKAMTLHSLGLLAVKSAYRKFHINNGKNFDLIKQLQNSPGHKMFFKRMSWEDKLRWSYTLMDMNDVSRLFLTDDIPTIKKHFASMDKSMVVDDRLPQLWESFIELRNATYEGDNIVIDFNDMIYLPVIRELRIPIAPYYLMIDEAQDLNLCQHKMIDNLINQGDVRRWMAVGDSNQSIYGFSGAYSSSFELFLHKGNVVQLPLDICYRCPKEIINCANEVYDVMVASREEDGIIDYCTDPALIKDNSMVICRNSSPLISLYFHLLGLGKPCYIKGEDILSSILRFLKPYMNHTVHTAKIEMLYKQDELSREDSDEKRLEFYIFKENFANFRTLSLYLCRENDSINTLVTKAKTLFENKENATVLCTIHKSKGLEADVVYIVNENLIPSKFAKSPEQLRQEFNLKYVARTRAKQELHFLDI